MGNVQTDPNARERIQTGDINAAQTSYRPDLQNYRMDQAQQVGSSNFNQQGTPESYMSPYQQNVIDAQQRNAQRQATIAGNQRSAAATRAGALGGSRSAIENAEASRNLALQQGDIQSSGMQAAYQQAQQQFNADQARNMAAQQANQQAGLTTGQQNLQSQLSTQQLGAQSGMQAALANLNNQQQSAVQNEANRLQASGMNSQQAMQTALANQQAGLTSGQQNLQSQLSTQQLGAQSGLQAALANLNNQQQSSVQNEANKLQASGMNAQQAMQMALANQQAGLTSGQQNLQAQLSTQQLGAQSGMQAALANLNNQQQSAVQNEANRLQASGMNSQQAMQMALANQQAGLTTGQQNLQSQLSTQQLGTQTGMQAALANLNNEQQAQVQNAANSLQASGMNSQQAMQMALANQQAGLTTGQQNLQSRLSTQQLGTQTGMQTALANLNNQQQAAVQNEANRLQASGMNSQQAMQMALANQQNQQQANTQNLGANLSTQQLGAGQNLQSQLANQSTGLQAGLANQQMQYNAGLQNAQLQQQSNLANQQAGLTTNQQNLQSMLGTQQLRAGQDLQSQLANQSAFAQNQGQGLQQNLAGNQQALQNAQLAAQYGLAGQQAGEQSRQFGSNLGMQGLNQRLAAGSQLGALGQTQYGQQMGITQAQLQAGAQQQAMEQQGLSNQYQAFLDRQNYPYQNLSYMSNIIRGTPIGSNATSQMYQAPAPMSTQLIGAAGGIGSLLGAYNKAAGGSIKSYAGGGGIRGLAVGGPPEGKSQITADSAERFFTGNQFLPSPTATMLAENPPTKGISPGLRALIDANEDAVAAARSHAEQQPPTPQTTVAQDLGVPEQSMASMRSGGLASMPSGVMNNVQYADGGIIAFGGEADQLVKDRGTDEGGGPVDAYTLAANDTFLSQGLQRGKAAVRDLASMFVLRPWATDSERIRKGDFRTNAEFEGFFPAGHKVDEHGDELKAAFERQNAERPDLAPSSATTTFDPMNPWARTSPLSVPAAPAAAAPTAAAPGSAPVVAPGSAPGSAPGNRLGITNQTPSARADHAAAPTTEAGDQILEGLLEERRDAKGKLREITPAAPVKTAEEYLKIDEEGRANALKRAGVSAESPKDRIAALTNQATEARANRDQDRWLAAAAGFFAMGAGKSQYALQNMSVGLGVTTAQLKDVEKDYRKGEEARKDRIELIKEAQRQEVLGNYDRAEKTRDRALGREADEKKFKQTAYATLLDHVDRTIATYTATKSSDLIRKEMAAGRAATTASKAEELKLLKEAKLEEDKRQHNLQAAAKRDAIVQRFMSGSSPSGLMLRGLGNAVDTAQTKLDNYKPGMFSDNRPELSKGLQTAQTRYADAYKTESEKANVAAGKEVGGWGTATITSK